MPVSDDGPGSKQSPGSWRAGDPIPISGNQKGESGGCWSLIRIPLLLVAALVFFGGSIFCGAGLLANLEVDDAYSEYVMGAFVIGAMLLLVLVASHVSYARNWLAERSLGAVDVGLDEEAPGDKELIALIDIPGIDRSNVHSVGVELRQMEIRDSGTGQATRRRSNRTGAAVMTGMSWLQKISEGGKRWWRLNNSGVEVSSIGSREKKVGEYERRESEFKFDFGRQVLSVDPGTETELLVEIDRPMAPSWRAAVPLECVRD